MPRRIRHVQQYKIFVHKSNEAISAQLQLESSKTIAGKSFKFVKGRAPVEQSVLFGKEFGKMALAAGAKKIVFKRGKNIYHGRIKAFAEGLREAGLEF